MSKNIQFTDDELRNYEANKGRMHGALLCKLLLEQREENRWLARQYDSMLAERNAEREQLEKAKEFIKALILAHKATKAEDHYQTTGDARRFIGMD